MPIEHRPSGSDTWMRCTYQPILAATVPKLDSEAAAEGRRLHDVAARYLVGIEEPTPEDYAKLELYFNYIHELHNASPLDGKLMYVEKALQISNGYKGTADCIVLGEEYIDTCDLKTGAGVTVSADSWQGRSYCIGALKEFISSYAPGTLKGVRFHIIQPLAREGEPIKVEEYTLEQLLDFHLQLDAAITECTRKSNVDPLTLTYTPGKKQCRFCDARSVCPAVNTMIDKDVLTKRALGKRLGELLQRIEDVYEPWIKGIKDMALHELEGGHEVDGYMLAEKQGHRKWADPKYAAMYLEIAIGEAKAYKQRELISPAQAEKLVELEEGMTIKPSTGVKMVKDDGTRAPVEARNALTQFAHSQKRN